MLRYLESKSKKLKQLNINMQPGFSTKYCLFNKKILKFNKIIVSFYLIQLLEKQRLKFTFSLTEHFIKKYISFIYKNKYKKYNLYNILNMRLDSILFNLGISITLGQARQLIVHGYIFVNFVLIKSPSFLVKKGDILNISNKSYYIFNLCKKNLYNKYIKNTNINLNNIYICLNTLTCILVSLFNIKYSFFIAYNDRLINYYYNK